MVSDTFALWLVQTGLLVSWFRESISPGREPSHCLPQLTTSHRQLLMWLTRRYVYTSIYPKWRSQQLSSDSGLASPRGTTFQTGSDAVLRRQYFPPVSIHTCYQTAAMVRHLLPIDPFVYLTFLQAFRKILLTTVLSEVNDAVCCVTSCFDPDLA